MQYNIVRAWKDEEYEQNLPQQIVNPAGPVELSDADLELLSGRGDEVGPAKGVGYGKGKVNDQTKISNEYTTNFSFKRNNTFALINLNLTFFDLACSMFNNDYF